MFFDGSIQVDELFGQLIKSGSAVTVERTVRCYDGYELSCETVGDLAVEARKDGDVSYINIETTPIDVSADAGTDVLYQFRFTPGSVAGVRGFRIRLGLPEGAEDILVLNDDNDLVYNDDEELVYTYL